MASNYKYKSKNTIKSQSYTSLTTGIGTCVYDVSFNNVPITITSPYITAVSAVILSTSIYNQTVNGFNTITYYKAAASGFTNGGPFSGTLNYFSLDNDAIQTYTFNNSPIIQAGSFTTNAGGAYSASFNKTFNNIPHVVVSPTSTGLTSAIISCVVNNRTTTGFDALSLFKDGRSGQSGGGYYSGTFNYIAVDNSAVSTYKSNAGPTITSGVFNTDTFGSCTISNLGFNTGTVSVYCSPIDNANTNMISYNIRSVSTSSFSVSAYFKDGNSGQNGGGVFDGSFNYIAVAF